MKKKQRAAGNRREGKIPVLNADQRTELKGRLKQYQAMDQQDFVQMEKKIRQMRQEHIDRWPKPLGFGQMSASLREGVLGDDTRDRS
jgi:hypothetical protein